MSEYNNIETYAPAATQATPKTPISIGGWICRSLIPMIPLVGGIVYLIMLFIWSGDQTKEDTFRNWAKAQLIVMAVVVVLGIILAVVLGSVFSEALRYMQ
jgi:hypothetical protein